MTQADADRCRGKGEVVAVSDAVRFAPWADALYSCDAAWWEERAGIPGFAGKRYSRQPAGVPGVEVAPDPAGIGHHSAFAGNGGNSGYQAILLAANRRHRRVILLGFDCQIGPNGKVHFHGRHRPPLKNPTQSNFDRWIGWFDRLAPALQGIGIDVINCSRATALTGFRRMSLETALALS